jgi:hypothetical protein
MIFTRMEWNVGSNDVLDEKSKKTKSRKANLDFVIVIYNGDEKIESLPLEFKFGAETLTDTPQLIQNYDSKLYCPPEIPNVTRYMYDNLLTKDFLEKHSLEKPTFEDYNKYVNRVIPNGWRKKKGYEFQSILYAKTRKYNSKDPTVEFEELNERLRIDYLDRYGKLRFNIGYLTEIFMKQQKKTFLLYKNNEFVLERLKGNPKELKFIENKKAKLALCFTDKINNYEYRLCWKNCCGIAGIVWKFGVNRL